MVAAVALAKPAQAAPPAQDCFVPDDGRRSCADFSGTTRTSSSFSTGSPLTTARRRTATPAAFNIIPYVEAKFGGWYVKGGLYKIARALEQICRELGVRIPSPDARSQALGRHRRVPPANGAPRRTGRFRHGGLQPGRAHRLPAFSVRTPAQAGQLPQDAPRPTHAIFRRSSSISASAQVPATLPPQHFLLGRLPARVPAAVRRTPTRRRADDLRRGPLEGRSRPRAGGLRKLVRARQRPCPDREQGRVEWPAIAQEYGDRIIERLETRFGFDGLRDAIRVRRHFTPADFQTRYLATPGACTGSPATGFARRSSVRRSSRRACKDFYFVGGSTHPGGGLAAGLPERADGGRQNHATTRARPLI